MTALVVTSIILGLAVVVATVGIPLWMAWPWAQKPDYSKARQYLADKAAVRRPTAVVPGPRISAETHISAKTAA